MPDGMTFKENIQNEKNKWNNMNWKQRFSYFKTYYMIPLIVILIIISVMNKKDIQFVYRISSFLYQNKITCLVSIFNIYQYWYIEVVNMNPDMFGIITTTIINTDENFVVRVIYKIQEWTIQEETCYIKHIMLFSVY